jgi:SAM-dependent methyltransferase
MGFSCRDNPSIAIGKCSGCDLVQVMDFLHVDIAHYESDNYFPFDLRLTFEREQRWNEKRIERLRQHLPDASRRKILDFGCGVGGFLRRADRYFGSVVGFDLSPFQVDRHLNDGFSCVNRIEDAPGDVDAIVLFHVLEHLPRPWELLSDLSVRFPKVDRFFIEVPNFEEVLNRLIELPAYRQNQFHSDHVWYFTNKTLKQVVERADLKVLLDSQLQRYTLGNTLGWLAESKGGGQERWPWFNDRELNDAYERVLAKQGIADSVFMVCEPTNT